MAAPTLWIDARPSTAISGRARTLLEAFAERHVALTPRLATALADLEAAQTPAEEAVWGRAFRHAGQSVGQADIVGRTRFWRHAVRDFHCLVAEPVLRRAMTQVPALALVGAADLPRRQDRASAGDWMVTYEAVVDDLLDGFDAMGRGFWIETAVRLQAAAWASAQSRGASGRRRAALFGSHPEIDPVTCRSLYEIDPVFPDAFQLKTRELKALQKSERKRGGIRPKEGGVSGIRTSTVLDDLPDGLVSEFLLPRQLVLDRLLHEGLLVRHRPPFRQPKRDVLVMGLTDRRADGPGGAILKAAWADAAIRLQILMSRIGLPQSDLIWAEARATGLAADVLRVEDLSGGGTGLDPMLLRGAHRAARLYGSGLMPGFLDTLGASDPIPDDALAYPDLVPHLARAGLRRLRLRRRIAGGHLGPGEDIDHRPSDYARRLVFVVLPAGSETARAADTDWTTVRTRLAATLTRVTEEHTHVVALVPPASVRRAQPFAAFGDMLPGGRVEHAAPADGSAENAMAELAGGLSAAMMTAVMGVLDG